MEKSYYSCYLTIFYFVLFPIQKSNIYLKHNYEFIWKNWHTLPIEQEGKKKLE